ncbi:MAG: putative pmbA protein [Acidobacteria bacterium]|nr:putative pmbA protein [Acidobacteriota bacterium]
MSEVLGGRGRGLVAGLAHAGALDAEAYEKRGRSRRLERGPEGEFSSTAVEAGWAVRAGDLRHSWFASGAGELPLAASWPQPTANPLWLPEPRPPAPWSAPAAFAAPLAGESEARALLDAVTRELARELPGARLGSALFEEGASEWSLVSSRGVAATGAARAATLRLVAERNAHTVTAETWAFEAREMKPLAVARRLVDRLLALEGGARPHGSALLVAAPLAARLVEALSPWLIGREAPARASALAGRGGRLGAPGLRLVDDGALASGLLSSASDGEGIPCRELTLVEDGRFVRPLLAWWEAESPAAASGCVRRASYRDLPRRAATHLYLAGDPRLGVPELVAEAGDGAYLIDAEGTVAVEPASGRFSVAVTGFALESGRAKGGLGRRVLAGTLGGWLGGVRAAARDLTFVAGDGMFGSPTLLVDGLDLGVPGS